MWRAGIHLWAHIFVYIYFCTSFVADISSLVSWKLNFRVPTPELDHVEVLCFVTADVLS